MNKNIVHAHKWEIERELTDKPYLLEFMSYMIGQSEDMVQFAIKKLRELGSPRSARLSAVGTRTDASVEFHKNHQHVLESIDKMIVENSTVALMQRSFQIVKTEDIKIYPFFAATPPREEKMMRKEQYFNETGLLQSQIILDSHNNLVDGYTSYLLAVKYGIRNVSVKYCRRQIVRASFHQGGKLYTYELPGFLIDRVFPGDKALIRRQNGYAWVKVMGVEECAWDDPGRYKGVLKTKRKARI